MEVERKEDKGREGMESQRVVERAGGDGGRRENIEKDIVGREGGEGKEGGWRERSGE
jgi:hypothetical protein